MHYEVALFISIMHVF